MNKKSYFLNNNSVTNRFKRVKNDEIFHLKKDKFIFDHI